MVPFSETQHVDFHSKSQQVSLPSKTETSYFKFLFWILVI